MSPITVLILFTLWVFAVIMVSIAIGTYRPGEAAYTRRSFAWTFLISLAYSIALPLFTVGYVLSILWEKLF